MILVLDNYDSFTYNLVHLLYTLNAQVEVRRNREITVDEAIGMNPDAILLSPGPGRPENAGSSSKRSATGFPCSASASDIRRSGSLSVRRS